MNTGPDLWIHPADPDDLSMISAFPEQHRLLGERLERQREERGVLLIAWLGTEAVGRVYVWWEEADEPEIQDRLPRVPLLLNLWVRAALRGRGIGTALMTAAEDLLRGRGYQQVALGVSPDNHGAMRLYCRLGYRRWPYPDISTHAEEFLDNGDRLRRKETCRVFVKDLS